MVGGIAVIGLGGLAYYIWREKNAPKKTVKKKVTTTTKKPTKTIPVKKKENNTNNQEGTTPPPQPTTTTHNQVPDSGHAEPEHPPEHVDNPEPQEHVDNAEPQHPPEHVDNPEPQEHVERAVYKFEHRPRCNGILIAGPPGAGKGTQCGLIIKRLKYKHISTGDLLRAQAEEELNLDCKLRILWEKGCWFLMIW